MEERRGQSNAWRNGSALDSSPKGCGYTASPNTVPFPRTVPLSLTLLPTFPLSLFSRSLERLRKFIASVSVPVVVDAAGGGAAAAGGGAEGEDAKEGEAADGDGAAAAGGVLAVAAAGGGGGDEGGGGGGGGDGDGGGGKRTKAEKPLENLSEPPPVAATVTEAESQRPVQMSCGHVEANLEVGALAEVEALTLRVKDKSLQPVRLEEGGEVGEYTNNRFSLMIPLDAKWD
jgi:hypothetical protein